ncbi:hypothetical protein DLJ49_09395 [Rhodovulum sp. 12E13]|uniref:hypothetical protein n=1 Tax=Rhodovulum sp. 12E13 TaxID=2203891 RepID=UPI000E137DC7|nr:hypothetical protein [Rhodovulum sp. 12E13]RDC72824.1 hypothetical protein DLJ49_09395 [Rhodovulum sp. 12E13]
MTRITALACVALACGSAAAQAQSTDLERFEAAAEAMSAQMFALIAEERPALAGALPDTDWGPAFREAGACVLDRIRTATSDDNVERMLGELEGLAGADFGSLAEMRAANDSTGPGLPQERMMRINSECGMEDAMRRRMVESGFLQAMQQSRQGG